MTAELSERQREILGGDLNPKFLATVDAAGEPNVVPLLSLIPYDPGLVAFAEFMMWKTRKNLDATGVASFVALDGKLDYFTARATLEGFVQTGPLFDRMARLPMFANNPYNGIRAAGTLRLDEVTGEGSLPALSLLFAHLRARRLARAVAGSGSPAAGCPLVPGRVAEKFGRLKAVKAIAWRAETLHVLPVAGAAPVGASGLAIADRAAASGVPEGARVAVAVITMDPVAYQVKGFARRTRGGLLVEVTEAYSASPPLCGKLLASAG